MCLAEVANGASTMMGYDAAKANGAYQANVANANASLAEQQMVSVGQRGSYEQSQIRQKAKQVEGSQKATFAANGLDIQAGSPLSVLSDTAYLSEKDVQTNRYNTQMQMWGLDNQATQYRAQAKYEKAAANNKAWGSLLSGITTAAKQYSSLND